MDRSTTRRLWTATVRFLLVATGLGVLYAVVPLEARDRWWSALVGAAVVLAVVPITVRRVRRVLASDRPVLDAIEALAVLLTMLILGFSAIYATLARHGGELTGLETRVDAVYFTVTTLSTVGFGDIAATGQAARIVVTIQILFDLTFLAVTARVLLAASRRRYGERS